MTVVTGLIGQIGWQATCLVTIGAGVLQIVFGVSRIARAALAIAPVVVHAMLAGIGATIALQQIHVLLGATSQSSAWANLRTLPQSLASQHGPDVLIGALVIAMLLCWPRLPAKFRAIPAALVAIVAATALASALQLAVLCACTGRQTPINPGVAAQPTNRRQRTIQTAAIPRIACPALPSGPAIFCGNRATTRLLKVAAM
ncbi:Probable transmembrane carbonic anhydrase [Mycobacteroides abscessus subsp. bolletii]|nr:Probable transmembrane carbonic anhydrase [Mycobacteroides abscessus subsp. bolletii]SHR73759.1 Probable transmembrane carbonic anhydrase [Mycobacteroides abscessus subsp. bolletii]SHT17062.1 Probable transmembrane carbonic anhydrase [Mycobacteroides abscessus subsp. bolletii]SKG05831.1 Probable transmembrane carbonic anhydrase [Mycobacteroides abscessus subsp. bolletii]SKG72527.1 Probable transmembrane carbonic anhydrase [Mycobacteroides abscessus subsp. bolletii]